ncbi:DUF3592 domain-containing protein [Marinobacter pelagius]|uniref:DUF3592 domain-containing protein n=1 Tax=Marinobacter sp. C7 TaxID=2951363 RepID=UPI001EF029C3|nr:DUF3592 domain-containing protein [Marinobacter sp. C7]
MAAVSKKKKSGLGVSLFGLIFLAAGLGVLALGPLHTLYEHAVSADWRQVPATLESVNVRSNSGSDSTTYSVEAAYRYHYSGRNYYGSRVGYDRGSDNISDYHHELASRLRRASSQGHLTAWVNPEVPSESYLVRELRWEKMLFMTIFGAVFSGVGLFVMLMGRKKAAETAMAGGPIHSSEKHGFWMFGFMAFMFIGISLPAVLAIPDELGKDNWPILAVLLFPMAGLWLAYMAWKNLRNWRYYGPAPLALDPSPGQIGGDVAGRINLVRRLGQADWLVTLQCLRIRISRGKNSSRSESVIWQADQVPEVTDEAGGSVVRFRFTPPTDLPETDNEGSRQVEWRLLLTGPGQPIPLERTYELPVVQGTQTSSISLSEAHVEHHERQARMKSLTNAAEQIDVQMLGNGVLLHSRAGRNLALKAMVLIFGLIFGGVSVGLAYVAAEEGVMLYFMALMFGLFGFPMFLGGLFMLGRSLKARIAGSRVEAVRYWGGMALWKRSGNLVRADQLNLKGGMSMNSGRRTTEYFSLEFRDATGGKVIRLAEGIAGRAVAEALRDNLIKLLRLD